MVFVWFPLLISLTFLPSNLSHCSHVFLQCILKLLAIITIYGKQARAWAQARPGTLASPQFGPGSGFWKPKPTKAWPDTSLVVTGVSQWFVVMVRIWRPTSIYYWGILRWSGKFRFRKTWARFAMRHAQVSLPNEDLVVWHGRLQWI